MDIQAHYQALYDAARTGLDIDHSDVPLLHVDSNDAQTGEPMTWPFVIYRQDIERSLGTVGSGSAKVLRSSWIFTAYAFDLHDALDYLSAVATSIIDADLTTTDGYVTTNIELQGIQSLFEDDAQVYACHARFEWERSI